jgi:hemoglobin
MVDFWWSIALRTGTYQGKPKQAHRGKALVKAHFERSLDLFGVTAWEVCEPDLAEFFIDRAHRTPTACRSASTLARKHSDRG